MRTRRSALGIEIDGSRLRIVEAQGSGSGATITKVHTEELAPGIIGSGVVMRAELLGEAIGKGIEKMGTSTRSAVLGLPASIVTMRVLDVPIVSPGELRAVVEGEVIHFEILREEGGVFDFHSLKSPKDEGDTEPQVLLMAVEESILNGYRDAMAKAGLQIEAIEPLHMAMYRSSFSQISSQGTTTFVSIGELRTEIGLISQDELALYRRVEIGANDLLPDPTMPSDDKLREASVSALTTELRRSLDYFHREFPDAPVVARIILATQTPRLVELAEILTPLVRAEVEIARPQVSMAGDAEVAKVLEMPDGVNFIPAIGLAMLGVSAGSPKVPSFDLASLTGRGHELRAARKSLMTSVAAAVIIAMIVGGAAAMFGARAGEAEDRVANTEKAYQQLQAKYRPESAARMAQVTMLRDLSNEGVPFQPLMDGIASSLDPNLGITQIRFTGGDTINMAGDATSEVALINTIERMRQMPFFMGTTVDSFDKGGPKNVGYGLRFSITTHYVGSFADAQPETPAKEQSAKQ
jgi:Tfp pilus assembly PilM family ATPase